MPRKNTRWKFIGTRIKFEIVGLWGRGFGNKYQVTGYDLKFDHLADIEYRDSGTIADLIRQKKIQII